MFRSKKLTCTILFSALCLLSLPSFAFDLPKGFTSFDLPSYSQTDIFIPVIPGGKRDHRDHAETVKNALLAQYSHWEGTQYRLGGTTRHVGVYIGDHQFIHASKSQGVTISSLDSPYWVDHYETARRLEWVS